MAQGPTGLLRGRVAIVTGGSSGIGRATAIRMAAEGASLVVADIRDDPREGGEPTADVIKAAGGTAEFVTCDVTKEGDRAAAVEAAAVLGGPDVLVNCAGIFRGRPLLETSIDDYRVMMAVNVEGTMFMSKVTAAAMVAHGRGGSIINLSSIGGTQGHGGYTLYNASKGAVRLFTYAFADEMGPHNVRVNALHPGLIETSMTKVDVEQIGTAAGDAYIEALPLRRAGKPDDVARAATFLASDLAEYVTGSSLGVDGGMIRV